MPGADACPNPSLSPHVRRWTVTHACDRPETLLLLAEAQNEIGMRPGLLTPSGWVRSAGPMVDSPPLSLVHAWREVRNWRLQFELEHVGVTGDVLHAHCFSSGMAGVRAGLPVVYDFVEPVGTRDNTGPWLTRSLRVAERFVLSRAAAIVVHSQRMWDTAVALGVRPEDLFLIPDPIAVASTALSINAGSSLGWSSQHFRHTRGDAAVTFYASYDSNPELLLRAFALIAEEVDGACLLADHASAALEQRAAEFGLAGRVRSITEAERTHALASADVIIAGAAAEGPNPLAIAALAHGCTLLAADVAANREVSAHGRGCLWYAASNERDLAYRAAFLARNPDFRGALAAAGRAHLQATRGPHAVARRYDEVYRHAVSRHDRRPDLLLRAPAFALCC